LRGGFGSGRFAGRSVARARSDQRAKGIRERETGVSAATVATVREILRVPKSITISIGSSAKPEGTDTEKLVTDCLLNRTSGTAIVCVCPDWMRTLTLPEATARESPPVIGY